MTELTDDISAILKTVRRPGDFYASGAVDLPAPGIDIDGFGPLALPVLPDQGALLIAAAELAPFGRGEETIVDTSVRRSWQIPPQRVRFGGKRWPEALAAIVARAAEGLGVDDGVKAEFYKLLIYDTGGFFVSHRDTEKSPGMFATLVIALPSISTGGDLVVRHAGRDARISMSGDDPAEARFAAFYADCVHEVLPVESGRRVTLIYNLVRAARGQIPIPPQHDREEQALVALLASWEQETNEPGGPVPAKIVYPLAHAYTPAEISFASLKGADAAASGALINSAAKARCDLHLALLTVEQTGSAEYRATGRSGRGRWREPDEDDFEMGEIYEHSETLTHWRRPDGAACDFGQMPVSEDEFSPPGVVEGMTPDEKHFREATGNEGATIERTYARAALVLWPRAGFLAMIAAAGLAVSLPYLADIVSRARSRAGGEWARLADEAHQLARAMIVRWSAPRAYWRADEPTSATSLLQLLTKISAADLIRAFLESADATQSRSKADNPAVIEALSLLPPSERAGLVAQTIGDLAAQDFVGCADLLARAAKAWKDMSPAELTVAAKRLRIHFPRDDAPAATHGRPNRPGPKMVEDLLGAFCRIDIEMAQNAVGALLASPNAYDIDKVLIPALRNLIAEPALATTSPILRLRVAVIAHLKTRIALPLAPPSDLRRASVLTCNCVRCAQLAHFLSDPAQASWVYKAAQFDRSHVESTIRDSHSDVDTKTDRKGSPHKLVVTKNQASYNRLAVQRSADLAMLETIGGAEK